MKAREKELTENGLAYQIQRAEVSLQLSMSSWRRQANQLERLLCDSDDIDCIRKERDNLVVLFNSTCSAADDYGRMVSDEVRKSFQVKIEVIDVAHQKLSSRISARIQDIMFETKSSTTSMKSRQEGSRTPRTSKSSRTSKVSNSSRMAEAAAEAAALKEKLEFFEIESHQTHELEKTQTMKEIKMAEARIEAISKFEAMPNHPDTPLNLPDGKYDHLKEFISTQPLNPQSDEFIPVRTVQN